MKLKSGFIIRIIKDTPYLIPYGQRVHEAFRVSKLNTLSHFIVEMLSTEISYSRLRDKLIEFLEAVTDDEKKLVTSDLDDFLRYLRVHRYLDEKDDSLPLTQSAIIAGIKLAIHSDDALVSISHLEDFNEDDNPSNNTRAWQIILLTRGVSKPIGENMLLSTREIEIYETDRDFLLFPRSSSFIGQISISKEHHTAYIYHDSTKKYEELGEDLFSALRFIFLYAAERRGMYAIHSSSILYKNKAVLFTGPSGTGKSTHAALWNRLFNTPFINGDLNLLDLSDGLPKVIGIPWCGTSGIYSTETHPLGAIVGLHQAIDNHIAQADTAESVLVANQRIISPSWTADQMNNLVDFCEQLIPLVPIFELSCNMDDEAAIIAKKAIDDIILK